MEDVAPAKGQYAPAPQVEHCAVELSPATLLKEPLGQGLQRVELGAAER